MPRLVVATANAGKLREIRALLGTRYELLALTETGAQQVDETGLTFVENAILKARGACAHTRLPALAEDSGLEVDALGGAPGIYSARFAGRAAGDAANNARLLDALGAVAERTARYRCVAVVLRHQTDPAPLICQGTWEGTIGDAPAGADGFGYDPLFRPLDDERSVAQMSAAEKNAVSHRAQALACVTRELDRFLNSS